MRGEPERPLGETKALVIGEVKLDLSWLAIGEAVAMALLSEEKRSKGSLQRRRGLFVVLGDCWKWIQIRGSYS